MSFAVSDGRDALLSRPQLETLLRYGFTPTSFAFFTVSPHSRMPPAPFFSLPVRSSLLFPQPLCILSLVIRYTPYPALFTELPLPISCRAGLCNLDCTPLHSPLFPPLPPRSPDMDKFIPVFSLTKRPSVSDTDCLGNHRAPVTLSHLSMSRTIMHTHTTHTHTHPPATHTQAGVCAHTVSRGRFKELCGVLMRKHIAACLRVVCMYVTEVSLHFCPAACI